MTKNINCTSYPHVHNEVVSFLTVTVSSCTLCIWKLLMTAEFWMLLACVWQQWQLPR